MVKGGIYLPMPEHVTLFCQSKSFVQCHQYLVGCEAIRDAIEQLDCVEGDERRKFQRIKDEVFVNVVVVDESGNSQKPFGATTLDMSLQGLRIQCYEELQEDLKVFFTFDDEFSVPYWKGSGEVKWTQALEGGQLFESGMIITDNETYHAVGQHIGIPGFPVVV